MRGLGCPVAFQLTGGHRGGVPQAASLIEGHMAKVVLADAAYDADHFRTVIAAMDAEAVIPNNPSRTARHPFDRQLYKERHLIECCFSKLKHFRRVATRHEKPPETISLSSHSPPPSSGCAKCPHHLGQPQKKKGPAVAGRACEVWERMPEKAYPVWGNVPHCTNAKNARAIALFAMAIRARSLVPEFGGSGLT